ncbi:MAG: TldD/PmbA family protein [Thermosphaera sp.]
MLDESLLHASIEYAKSLGAEYAETRYQKDYGFQLSMRNGKILGAGSYRKVGVGIRVLIGGSLGFAATNILDRENILQAVERAVSRAKSSSVLRRKPIKFSQERVGRATYEVVTKKDPNQIQLESIIEMGASLYSTLLEVINKVKIPVSTFSFETHLQEKFIATSEGALVRSMIPRIYLDSNNVLYHPEKGTLQRMISFAASGGLELIDEWNPVEKIIDEVKRLENVLVNGKAPPKEKVDVVVGSEIVGLLVHESAGHPMEADRILGREAAQAGESYVKPEFIGSFRVGNEYATVIEDPTIPGSNGFYLYDDEGVPARARYLYREGLVNEPLHNRHTAYLFGTNSNGAARAMDFASEPIIRMSNTYLKPGDMEFDELIEDIELGVYMKSYMEWNIDDVRWNQRYVGLEAYIIRNGELAEPVRDPILEITTQGFYSNIVAVDKNLAFYPGTCGKGEPSQGVPVWFGGPNVRLKKIVLGVRA